MYFKNYIFSFCSRYVDNVLPIMRKMIKVKGKLYVVSFNKLDKLSTGYAQSSSIIASIVQELCQGKLEKNFCHI